SGTDDWLGSGCWPQQHVRRSAGAARLGREQRVEAQRSLSVAQKRLLAAPARDGGTVVHAPGTATLSISTLEAHGVPMRCQFPPVNLLAIAAAAAALVFGCA